MADVAKLAGVSDATVSRALSGEGAKVSQTTLDRVQRAAAELGYQPNNVARNMRAGKARILGLIVSDITNPFFTMLVRGCEDAAAERGYSLVISNTDESADRERASIEVMIAERVAGVMIASTNETLKSLQGLTSVGIPIVAVDRRIDGVRADTVIIDNDSVGHLAASHLIGLGHRRIALVGGPSNVSSHVERENGFFRAMREHSLEVPAEFVQHGNLRSSGGYTATNALLDADELPTAIFSTSNLSTLGVLRSLIEHNVSVPEDMSVVGVDDIPGSELFGPGLTAVIQPTYQMGARAVELVLQRIKDPDRPMAESILAATFETRGSAIANPSGI